MFQIVPKIVADVTFTSGDRYEYVVTEAQLEQLRKKMHDGVGSLELQPDFGSRTDDPEILNVRAIARVKPVRSQDYTDALVQLWANPDTGRLYLVDPDDEVHAWCVDIAQGDNVEGRDFGMEAYSLIEGNATLADLGIPVGRPPADEVMWELVAACVGEKSRVRLVAKPDDMNARALAYLAATLNGLPDQ